MPLHPPDSMPRPAAAGAARVQPPSAPGRAVPAVLAVGLVALLSCGAYGLQAAFQAERLAPELHDPLGALQPWLPGQWLEVPDRRGLWAENLAGTRLLLAAASPDGPSQALDLCDRAHAVAGGQRNVHPIALVAGVPRARAVSGAAARAVVLDSALAPGLPIVRVEGRLPDDGAAADLRLQVRPAAAESAGTWQVALAEPVGPAAASVAPAQYRLGQEAWVLWSAPAVAGEPDPGAAALAHGAQPYVHGVRIRRVAAAGCRWGALEWQLFNAAAAPQAAVPPSATLLALPPQAAANLRPLRLALPPGRHLVPVHAGAPLEDQALFEQAQALGWIRREPDGRAWVAPADAGTHPVLKALYRSANGDHVRAQVRLLNQDLHWMALRVRPVPGQALPVSAEPARWHLSTVGETLAWSSGLPAVSARLMSAPPAGYSDWVRVHAPADWLDPALRPNGAGDTGAQARISLPVLAQGGAVPGAERRLQVLVLGEVRHIEGARVQAERPACDGSGCASPHMLRELTLALAPQARELTLVLAHAPGFNRLNPSAAEQRRIQVRQGQLAWVPPPEGTRRDTTPADVTVLARDRLPLFAQGQATSAAAELGLVPLVGLGPQHRRSLSGTLARLGGWGQAQVTATTTLEPAYQASLQAVLRCIGHEEGMWQPEAQRCQGGAADIPAQRISAAVLLDAHSGAVLASASGRAVPAGVGASELLAFDAFNPVHSPLQLPVQHHTGGLTQTPGSAFKVISGLMLEHQARRSPALDTLLQGQPAPAWEAKARAAGLPFQMASACYPAPCAGRTQQVENYKDAPATRYLENGRFGLVQALRHSVNTWFAMWAEMSDRTAGTGHEDARPLGQAALRQERPLLALTDELGFTRAWPLDGGLLPQDMALQPGDALMATPSVFDPLHDVHNIRQQALGLRMQTTPLQMARVAAGVATGRMPAVHLLDSLNGQPARPAEGTALTMRLDRVREGMHEVVRAGTAAQAFAAASLQPVRALVYGKTGTAQQTEGQCAQQDDPPASGQPCLNNAWFVGYLLPGAVPGETRTLAFAVQVTHTRRTGGVAAAAVVAGWMQGLWARASAAHSEPASAPDAAVR